MVNDFDLFVLTLQAMSLNKVVLAYQSIHPYFACSVEFISGDKIIVVVIIGFRPHLSHFSPIALCGVAGFYRELSISPWAKTINVFRACLGAQLTICAQK